MAQPSTHFCTGSVQFFRITCNNLRYLTPTYRKPLYRYWFTLIYLLVMQLYCYAAALVALGLTTSVAQAQTLPTQEPTASASAEAQAPKPTWLPNTLFKLQTGINRGFDYSGHNGLALPLMVGVEHQLNSKFSVYGEFSPLLQLIKHDFSTKYPEAFISGVILNAGGRYYYNQAGRAQHNRAHGAFIGNYLALQLNIDIAHYDQNYADPIHYNWSGRSVAALWGIQRRIGQWGLFNLDGGPRLSSYKYSNSGLFPDLLAELNIRIGLAH